MKLNPLPPQKNGVQLGRRKNIVGQCCILFLGSLFRLQEQSAIGKHALTHLVEEYKETEISSSLKRVLAIHLLVTSVDSLWVISKEIGFLWAW